MKHESSSVMTKKVPIAIIFMMSRGPRAVAKSVAKRFSKLVLSMPQVKQWHVIVAG